MKCIICSKELEGSKESIYISDYGYIHVECIKDMLNDCDKRKRPIKYDRLLQIVDKMHLWFFLHCNDEDIVYNELGLTDEENKVLGYSKLRSEIKMKETDNELPKQIIDNKDIKVIDLTDRNINKRGED